MRITCAVFHVQVEYLIRISVEYLSSSLEHQIECMSLLILQDIGHTRNRRFNSLNFHTPQGSTGREVNRIQGTLQSPRRPETFRGPLLQRLARHVCFEHIFCALRSVRGT
jgi:hypothetical protein